MAHIITIGREFGSGGREVGRRLAEALGYAYYDNEILNEIAKRSELSVQYVQNVLEQRPLPLLPIHTGQSFYPGVVQDPSQKVYATQTEIIKELASKGDCVIVGRCADYILKEIKPFRLFIYASEEAKLVRTKARNKDASLDDKQILKSMKKIDKDRSKYYTFYTGQTWGDRNNYDLMINTTNQDIKALSKMLADLIKSYE